MNTLVFLLNQLNLSIITKNCMVQIAVNKTGFQLIQKLYHLNLICFYKIVDHKKFRSVFKPQKLVIYLNPSIQQPFTLVSKPGNRVYVSKKQLALLYQSLNKIRGNQFLLLTPYGLLTITEAFYKKCGGELLCKI